MPEHFVRKLIIMIHDEFVMISTLCSSSYSTCAGITECGTALSVCVRACTV